ncbi:hypothetical protein BDA96_10G092000 [Sorghum bicolor]|uniref:Uncharacterized protein n=1 Tax=Sorghum bicolor TaxID=4558 RepID=A0A921U0G0_SORBI|nr:hypothetical protein BDA96_10G092000 [Sorghum bicolor]
MATYSTSTVAADLTASKQKSTTTAPLHIANETSAAHRTSASAPAFINPLSDPSPPSPRTAAASPPHSKPQDHPLPPTTMVTAVSAAAVVDLCAAFIALDIFTFLDPQLGADPSAEEAALLDSAVELLLPLAALGTLATGITVIYRHLQHSAAAAAGAAGSRRLYRFFAILCASVGTLEFFFFVQPAGSAGGNFGAQARALGLVAARVLPAAAAATFFLGMALIIVSHIRAGGEGGGGAFAGDGHIQGAVSFLTKTAFAAAAALIWLTALALYGIY